MNLSRLDWDLCRSFLAILRGGSLSEAARSLGVAHPTVRRHLEELEAALGTTLFTRSPTGLVPTELAVQLRETAEAMESAAENLVRSASAKAGGIAGTVRISASEVVGVEVLPDILAGLRNRHGDLAIELKVSNVIDDVLRRDVDIAIRMTRPTQVELAVRKIGAVRIGLFAHIDWLTAYGEPQSIEAVIDQRSLVGYDRNPALIQWLSSRGVMASKDAFSFRCDNDVGQLAAIRAALGVGLCQIPLAARYPKLKRVLPSYSVALEVWLATHPNLKDVPRVRATLEGLARGLRDYLRAEAHSVKSP
ncbi:MAG: LysR family transcriptional regulator [Hyphomicrobium sp.]|jgi:DNA-binding transcriptional LysR family regulator